MKMRWNQFSLYGKYAPVCSRRTRLTARRCRGMCWFASRGAFRSRILRHFPKRSQRWQRLGERGRARRRGRRVSSYIAECKLHVEIIMRVHSVATPKWAAIYECHAMQPHHHPHPYPVSLQVRARSQTEQDCICRAPCTTSADIIIINKCKSSPTRGGGRARWRTTIYGMSSSSSRADGWGAGEPGRMHVRPYAAPGERVRNWN